MNPKIMVTLMALCIVLGVSVVYGAGPQAARGDARHVISRTAAVIGTAQRFAAQGGRCDGLGVAIAHQVYARELFGQGVFSEAIYHSLRGRVLAARLVSQLNGTVLYDRLEERFAREIPSDQELDQKLRGARVSIMSDQAAVNTGVALDVN